MLKPFISSLGKFPEVAARLSEMSGRKLRPQAIHQWPREGKVPGYWQPFLVRLAKEKGVDVPDELKPVEKIMGKLQ